VWQHRFSEIRRAQNQKTGFFPEPEKTKKHLPRILKSCRNQKKPEKTILNQTRFPRRALKDQTCQTQGYAMLLLLHGMLHLHAAAWSLPCQGDLIIGKRRGHHIET
jgi:hypothetical protein